MTREEAKRMLPIMQAYADGKTIEILDFKDKWKEADDLSFKHIEKVFLFKIFIYR